jgi:hypothetical protein
MINVVLILGIDDMIILKKRLDKAIQEYQSFQQNFHPGEGDYQNFYFMISGSKSHEYMFEYTSKYIDPKYLIVEDKSMTTYQNLVFSFEMLENIFQSSISLYSKVNITICTSSFHIKQIILLSTLLCKGNFDFKFVHTNEPVSKSLELEEKKHIYDLLNHYTNNILKN